MGVLHCPWEHAKHSPVDRRPLEVIVSPRRRRRHMRLNGGMLNPPVECAQRPTKSMGRRTAQLPGASQPIPCWMVSCQRLHIAASKKFPRVVAIDELFWWQSSRL